MIQNRLLLAGLMAIPTLGHALGLGKLELNSALNEPFDARIELLSATVEELDSLKVILADTAAFERANIDRPFLLSQLKFEVKETEGGGDFIHIHSPQAIREPFLNFLLEISWSRGRLFREYTVLLDPPLYDPNARRQSKVTTSSPTATTSAPASEDNQVVYDLDYQQPAAPKTAVTPTISGHQYGPTQAGDTLWSIAASMRPNNSVSVQQIMNALFQANPDAFINGNINGLKKGQVLNLPDLNTIQSMGQQDSIDMVRTQEGLWNELRDQQADSPSVRAETSDSADASASTSGTASEDDPELRLLSAETDGEGIDSASEMESAEGAMDASATMNDEAIAVLEMENQELQNRLSESESIIEDLKRLIELKEDELATLQNQFANPETEMESTEAVEEETLIETESELADTEVETDSEFEEDESDTVVMEEESDAGMEFEEEGEAEFEEAEEELAEESTEVVAPAADTSAPVEQSAGAMGMVEQYLAPVQGFVMANLTMVGGALGAILVALLGLVGFRKMQANKAESVELPLADLPDFDEDATEIPDDPDTPASADLTEQPAAEDEDEDATVVKGSEDETVIPDAGEDQATEETAADDFSFDLGDDDEEEEDPLAEVNVFLAYEHFDQAEEFVKNAINDQPDNLEFHGKLLEVYYASGNKSAYEDAAKVLHEKSGGSGEHWDMAVAMWSEMSPNRALFEERAEGMDETIDAPQQEGEGIVDIFSADESGSDSETLDISAGGSDILEMTTTISESDDDNSLDMTDTLTMDEPVISDTEDDDDLLDLTAAGDEDDLLDLTAEPGDDEMLDVTSAAGIDQTLSELDGVSPVEDDDDDLLDITGGVDEDDLLDASSTGLGGLSESTDDDDVLDISGAGLSLDGDDTGEEDNSVDFELPLEDESSDLLDASSEINMDATQAGEDLLDVTSASIIEEAEEESPEEDLELDDIGTSMDLDLDGLDLDIPDSDSADTLDADIDDIGETTIERAMESSNDDNVLEFDVTAGATADDDKPASEDTLLMEIDDDADNSLDIDMDLTATGGGISEDFALDTEDSEAESESLELDEDISLDMDISDDSDSDDSEGLEIDLADTSDLDLTVGGETDDVSMDLDLEIDPADDLEVSIEEDSDEDESLDLSLDGDTTDSDELDLEISLDDDTDTNDDSDLSVSDIDFDMTNTDTMTSDLDDELSLDLEIQDDAADDELDMEGTVELPQGAVPSISIDDDEDEDDEDATVFVPKSPGSEEQSQEDEVSTKLDLAKAYVELGDQDSARSILNEILQEGNDSQKQQAQDLMNQVNS